MKSKSFLTVIIFCFAILLSTNCHAAPVPETEAKAWVEDKGRKLLETFSEKDRQKKYEDLDYMLLNYVDLEYISRFVIGKYWKTMTSKQRKTYQNIFTRYALAVYKNFPLEFGSGVDFIIIDVNKTKSYTDVVVQVKVNLSDNPEMNKIPINFILSQNKDKIKIIDLKLGESSLILSYRNRFYEMMTKAEDEVEWFLEDFEDLTRAYEYQHGYSLPDEQKVVE